MTSEAAVPQNSEDGPQTDERTPAEKFQFLLEGCCYTCNPEALSKTLEAANSSPELHYTACLYLGSLYQLATSHGHVAILDALHGWQTSQRLHFSAADITSIAEIGGRPNRTAACQAGSCASRARKAREAYKWWLDKVNLDFGIIHTNCLMLLWAISLNDLGCLYLTLRRLQSFQFHEILNDPIESFNFAAVVADVFNTKDGRFVETHELLRLASGAVGLVDAAISTQVGPILVQATSLDDLQTLIYLLKHTTLFRNPPSSLVSNPNNPFYPLLPLDSLSPALETALQQKNFAAALLLRQSGTPIRFEKPVALWKRVGSDVKAEQVRRAMNVLWDDAWNVMQHTGRLEVRSVFERAREEIERAEGIVEGRLSALRRQFEAGGEGQVENTEGLSFEDIDFNDLPLFDSDPLSDNLLGELDIEKGKGKEPWGVGGSLVG